MTWSRRKILGHIAAAGACATSSGWVTALGTGAAAPVVSVRSGKVQGRSSRGICAYLGIPYGQNTAGRGRHAPPRDVEPWDGVRRAVECGPPCFQINTDLRAWVDPRTESEDCLCLNVWTPKPDPTGALAVMVWIHGGAYTSGSGGLAIYDGTALAQQGVVVVSINHRLGPFGYLYLGGLSGEFAESGNVGQLDIIASLKWVRDNIAAFGGDPTNVTVFGESGGGGKISTLALMPAARGSFHKAIIQSGSLCNTVDAQKAHRTTLKILERLSISPRQFQRLFAVPPAQLLLAADAAIKDSNDPLALGPVLDGHAIIENDWLNGAPEQVKGVPFLIGTNIDEAAYFVRDPVHEPADDAQLRQQIVEASNWVNLTASQATVLVTEYRRLLPQLSRLQLLIAITTDLFLWRDALDQAEHQVQQGEAPVYMYDFTWKTPCFGGEWAPHGAEIPLMFGNMEYSLAWDEQDTPQRRAAADPANERYRLSRKMMAAWTAFARTGDPHTPSLPEWAPYDVKRRATMQLGAKCEGISDPRGERRALIRRLL